MNDVSPLPQPITSDDDCAAAIAEVGSLRRALDRIATDKAAAIAKATEAAESKASSVLASLASLEGRITAWCKLERTRLTEGGNRQHAEFATGTVHWHAGGYVCEIDKAVEKRIVEPLRKCIAGHLKKIIGFYAPFVSVTVAWSKTKLKAAEDGDKVKLRRRGIRFVRTPESFMIEPAGAALADRPEPAETE